jgi:MFS family permease
MPRFVRNTTALRHRDFRLLLSGLLVSVTGSMMQSAAILWHVYDITHDPLALGAVGLVRILPIIGFSLISGVVADSFDRRKLMLAAQAGMALCAVVLGFLAMENVRSVWPIYLVAALSSAFGAFDLPARQALVPSLVPLEDLSNAFSLNATMFQIGSIVGPASSGILISHFGLAWAYWINAASFFAIIAALLAMTARPMIAPEHRPSLSLSAVKEGLRFVLQTPLIFSSMLLDFFATFFSSATALLPIYARDILHVGATGYGWLYAAQAVGALVTGLLLSLTSTLRKEGPVLLISVLIYGLATILFGFSKVFWFSFIALAIGGAADTVSMVIRNTIRQLNTPDHLRGRTVAINMIFFMGGPQLGEMEAGAVASWLGAPFSVISGGACCILALFGVVWKWPFLWKYDQKAQISALQS